MAETGGGTGIYSSIANAYLGELRFSNAEQKAIANELRKQALRAARTRERDVEQMWLMYMDFIDGVVDLLNHMEKDDKLQREMETILGPVNKRRPEHEAAVERLYHLVMD